MAIRDYDGTAAYEIGKLRDWDGTATHQIGKVYDNDGTASSMIYSAETVLFDPSLSDPYCTADSGGYEEGYTSTATGSSSAISPTSLTLTGQGNSGRYIRTKNKIDFSNYSKLIVTFNTSVGGSNNNRWFTIKIGEATYGSMNTNKIYQTQGAVGLTTMEFDISSFNMTDNLVFMVHAYASGSPTITATIKKAALK